MRYLENQRKKLQIEVYCLAKVYQENLDVETSTKVDEIIN
jgi:hypothetical protein